MAQLSDDCFAQGGKLMRTDEALDLQSEVGVGTTVTVRFPAERIVASLDDSDSLGVEGRAAS